LTSTGEWDDSRLVAGLQARDPEAVQVLFESYASRLFNYAYYHSSNRPQSEDITSETLSRVIERISGYELREIPFKAWVFKIAHNLLVDYFRQRAKQNEVSLDKVQEWDGLGDAGAADGGDLASQMALREEITQAIARLPEDQRTVFVLRFVQGFELEQVCVMLEKTLLAVKSLQYRAVQNLKIYLSEPEPTNSKRKKREQP